MSSMVTGFALLLLTLAARAFDVADDAAMVQLKATATPVPFVITPGDQSQCGGGDKIDKPDETHQCFAKGWVYCQDAQCDQTPIKKDGVWVAKCHCWQPTNTNYSILPGTSGTGANCVVGDTPGGKEMCDQIAGGALISTYGPLGTKPKISTAVCKPRAPWVWCWGAPCSSVDGDIICDCPLIVTNSSDNQQVSLPSSDCQTMVDSNKNPCDLLWNSQVAGESAGAGSTCYTDDAASTPVPFVITPGDQSQCGGGDKILKPDETHQCFAKGWVYCQDAQCDQTPIKKDGVWVAKCHCWQPTNTNYSILPGTSGTGANCVVGDKPGGKEMCDQIAGGALISTYGPLGTKPKISTAVCHPRAPWVWCWGAPCSSVDGDIICHCPLIVTNSSDNQQVSLPSSDCQTMVDASANPCNLLWNSQVAGESDGAGSTCYTEA